MNKLEEKFISRKDPFLYDTGSIEDLQWEEAKDGNLIKNYFAPLIKNGIHHYIENIHARMAILRLDSAFLPLLIIDDSYENSYVCSPYGHYITWGLELLGRIDNQGVKKIGSAALKSLGKVLKAGKINKIIYVNHWLFSTDLYSEAIAFEEVQRITTFLRTKFPQHAIAFRSINEKTTSNLRNILKKCNFSFIRSRCIYVSDAADNSLFETRIIKSDLKVWKESDYEVVEGKDLVAKDDERILELYNMLQIHQHSMLNPNINLRFIQLLRQQGNLQIKALRKNGIIEGFVGYIERNQILLCPFIGYDKNHQEKTRIYRLLSILLLLEARKKNELFHQSAGASFYKTIRRAKSCQEYLAVCTSHLPPKQKMVWTFLRLAVNTFAAPFMKKY